MGIGNFFSGTDENGMPLFAGAMGGAAGGSDAAPTPYGQTGSAGGSPPAGAGPVTAPPPTLGASSGASAGGDLGNGLTQASLNAQPSPVHHAVSLLGPNHPVSKFLTGMGALLMHQNQLPNGMTHAQAMGAAMGPALTPTSTGQPMQVPQGDPAKQTLQQHISGMLGTAGAALMGGGGASGV